MGTNYLPLTGRIKVIWNRYRKGLAGYGRNLTTALCLLIISLYSLHPAPAGADGNEAPAEEKKNKFKYKLTTKSGGRILPIPIFITEPAIGYGLGVGVAYIHPEKNKPATEGESPVQSLDSIAGESTGRKPPPTITGIGGGYTDKDTWAVAVGHQTSWREDTIRFKGALAYLDVKSSYYIVDEPLNFNLISTALYAEINHRLGGYNWFLGAKLAAIDSETDFDTRLTRSGDVDLTDIQLLNVGLALAATYDGRDNTFTPNNGEYLQLDFWRFDEGLGGDFNFWKGKAKMLSYHPLGAKFVLGLRAEAGYLEGDRAPFYAYPWVKLRGIPALRYQGNRAGELEAELRWNFLDRWALLGFGGAGMYNRGGTTSSKTVKSDIYAGGLGGRYFLMQDLGLWVGLDVAHGTDDLYTYITIGSAW
jgi:hypothetical protein